MRDEIAASRGVGLDGIRPSSIPDPLSKSEIDTCRLVQSRMRAGSYRFTPYREVLATKGRGRLPRVISIPTVRDRLVLKTLSHILHDVYGYSGPAIAQRMVGKVGSVASRWAGFVRVDLEDYFGSIEHGSLMRALSPQVRSRAVRRRILAALENPTVPFGSQGGRIPTTVGIPQGLSISSVLAEIFLAKLDEKWRLESSVAYFRYVDDIAILCNPNSTGEVFDRLCADLHGLHLNPHPLGTTSKTTIGVMSTGFDFLGYHFGDRGTSISPPKVRKIEDRIAGAFGEFRRMAAANSPRRFSWLNWKISQLTCGCIFAGEHRGWLRYYSRTNDISGLHHLDAMIRALAARSGLPPTMRFKKFVKAYYVTRAGRAFYEYIPNPETWTPEEARAHLVEVDGWDEPKVAAMSDSELRGAVQRVLSRDLADLERDLDERS